MTLIVFQCANCCIITSSIEEEKRYMRILNQNIAIAKLVSGTLKTLLRCRDTQGHCSVKQAPPTYELVGIKQKSSVTFLP